VEERLTAARDLQASTPEVRIGLSRAGVTGVQKAVRMQHGGHDALVSAEIDCFVDLDPAQKGVHMSRFPEVFEEAIDEVVIDGKLLVENLAEHIAKHIVERQQALRAEVKIAARYPIERLTPVTGLRTQELVTLIGLAAASPSSTRRVVGVEATGINACPCAQGLVREEATERLGEAGFDEDDVDRILELVPLATHNQRGRGTLYLGTQVRLDAEDLVDIVEQSMSSPIYELLKRPDELFVVEHAHLTPRFVEDSVRLMVKGALDSYLEVLAERFGTVGELRAELANGGHSARHTELRDWLRSVS
jgi:GTP cyclohydrolase-4